MSKVLGKFVMYQLMSHLHLHNLLSEFQSVSTEIALVTVINDLSAMDNGLILLDLSAAFDTIDHDIGHNHQPDILCCLLVTDFGNNLDTGDCLGRFINNEIE